MSIVRAASQQAQLVDNAQVQAADELLRHMSVSFSAVLKALPQMNTFVP